MFSLFCYKKFKNLGNFSTFSKSIEFPPLLYYNEADLEMNSTHKSNDEESNAIKFSQREEHMLEVP